MLREEVRVTPTVREEPWSQRYTVRSEYLEVNRTEPSPTPDSWPPSAEDFVRFRDASAELTESIEQPRVVTDVERQEEVVPIPKPRLL
jgi:hypothetical protein